MKKFDVFIKNAGGGRMLIVGGKMQRPPVTFKNLSEDGVQRVVTAARMAAIDDKFVVITEKTPASKEAVNVSTQSRPSTEDK